ncbi:MAG: WXG100 family type VII secretion target [Actinomadura sp.]
MSGDLIATPEAQKPTEGAGIVDSITGLVQDAGDDKGWAVLAVDGVAVGLDTLGIALDPLGAILSAGVGWLLEHVAFLREPLEVLTGDPKQIQALSQTWSNIATELQEAAGDYEQSLGAVASWGGTAAAAYRKTAREYSVALRGVAAQANSTSQGIAIAGQVVATERAFIFAVISEWIGKVIAKAILAVAWSVATFGGSLAFFTASVIADAVVLFAKLAERLARLLKVIGRFVERFRLMGARSADAAAALGRKADGLSKWAAPKINGGVISDALFAPEGYKRFTDMMDASFVGDAANVAGSVWARTGAEAAKQGKDFYDGMDDGHWTKDDDEK